VEEGTKSKDRGGGLAAAAAAAFGVQGMLFRTWLGAYDHEISISYGFWYQGMKNCF
jgi:asparagine N-glycosylation enzyme membrane subunit Stt3